MLAADLAPILRPYRFFLSLYKYNVEMASYIIKSACGYPLLFAMGGEELGLLYGVPD